MITAAAVGLLFIRAYPPATGKIRTIVIDAGHGGKDPGCQGSSHREKDIALSVALKLGKYIEHHLNDVKVIYTRTTDVFVQLEDRAQIANRAKADLFISIHCNAAGKPVIITDPKTGKKRPKTYRNRHGKIVAVETTNPVPFGSETYVMGLKNEEGKMRVATRENSAIFLEDDYEKKYGGFDPESEESYIIMSNYTSAYVIQSANLAMKIQEEYAGKAGRIDKGVHRQSIWVLWRTSMPSILTELGYLTNPLEEAFMASDEGQEHLAKALFRAVRRYKDESEGVKKEYNDSFENQPLIVNENVKAGNSLAPKKQEDGETEQPKDPEPALTASATARIDSAEPVVTSTAIAVKFLKEKNTGPVTPTVAPDPATAVVFKVQFASSTAPINLKEAKYSVVTNGDFYMANEIYKYTSGRFNTLREAALHQEHLRKKGFKDCFVVAFRNNQRIDLGEARKVASR